ncbi:aminopeptidase [Alicyclobacillus curvatus]|nr:aminopeptidase [Alicyclobacillus curvatus]
MENFEQMLEQYAELCIKIGVNIQNKQDLLILASLDVAPFVRRVARHAYMAGAKRVYVEWNDDELDKTMFQLASEEALQEFPEWKAKGYVEMAKEGVALLGIVSSSPDVLIDVDPSRIATYMSTVAAATKEFADYQIQRKIRWTVIAVPSPGWATKVFPDLPKESAMEKLWGTIFGINRVGQPEPAEAWKRHMDTLMEKRRALNSKEYRKLHYNAPGTKLTIELPLGHEWYGGRSKNQDGIPSVANMPTEEIFTLPKRDGVNGTVRATKPLSFAGNLIGDFSFTFKDGRIVEFQAERGYEVLKNLLEMDDGARYLGEVALVPVDSPISISNLLFYQTLYDENASCHLAIGRAYPCFKNVENMSEGDITAAGANMSNVHVDFMIGSAEMDIDGELADGTMEPLFRKGKWAN